MIPVPSGVRVWIAAGHTDTRSDYRQRSINATLAADDYLLGLLGSFRHGLVVKPPSRCQYKS